MYTRYCWKQQKHIEIRRVRASTTSIAVVQTAGMKLQLKVTSPARTVFCDPSTRTRFATASIFTDLESLAVEGESEGRGHSLRLAIPP